MTSNENLADIGALQVSYDAWLDLHKVHPDFRLPSVDLTPHQLFFVGVAQVLLVLAADRPPSSLPGWGSSAPEAVAVEDCEGGSLKLLLLSRILYSA